jgi:hypothetical protein
MNGKAAKLRTQLASSHLSFDEQCRNCEKVTNSKHLFILRSLIPEADLCVCVCVCVFSCVGVGIYKGFCDEFDNLFIDKRYSKES